MGWFIKKKSHSDRATAAWSKGDFIKAKREAELGISENNDSNCLTLLGDLYFHGEGVQVDQDKAVNLYQLAVNQNNGEALIRMGRFHYFSGFGHQNFNLAFQYLNRAVSMGFGDVNDLDYLADMYYSGLGTEVDYDLAYYFAKKAYEAGSKESLPIYVYGLCYVEDSDEAVQEAARELMAGAVTGDARCLPLLKTYFPGRDWEKDLAEITSRRG